MAIIDALTRFCFEEPISGTAATRLEGDVIDTLTARDLGTGHPLYWNTVIEEALASAGAATVELLLVSDAQAAIAVDGSATVHARTGVLAYNAPSLALGKTLSMALPGEGVPYERYLGVLVITGAFTTTTGKITSFLSPSPMPAWKPYPEAVS